MIATTYNPPAAYVYHGSPTGLSPTPAIEFESSDGAESAIVVEGAGDVNGDAFDDIVVSGEARVRVHLGSSDGIVPTAATTLEGSGVPLGDINGDGFGDIAIGDAVHYGSEAGVGATPGTTLAGVIRWERAGDVNGDGFDDVLLAEDAYVAALFAGTVPHRTRGDHRHEHVRSRKNPA